MNLWGLAIDSDNADVGTVIDHRIFHSERCGKTDEYSSVHARVSLDASAPFMFYPFSKRAASAA
jgi:hypothetical protein